METNVGSDRIVPQAIDTPHIEVYTSRDRTLNVEPQVAMTYTFRNGLKDPVTTTMRNNLAFTYQPLGNTGRSNNQFTIIVTYRFVSGVKIDPFQYLTADVIAAHPDLKVFKGQLDLFKGSIVRDDTISIKYVFTMEDFKKAGGRFYVDDLGICLSIARDSLIDTHPESFEGKCLTKSLSEGFDFNVLINDPNNNYGDHFININSEVYRVKAMSIPSLKVGVYIRGTPPVPFDGSADTNHRFYSFDEIDKLRWLYATAAEAKSAGDPESQFKQRLREINERAEQERAEQLTRIAEADAARKEAESKAKLSEIEQKRALAELEAKYKQEEFERKRYQAELEQRASVEEHAMKREIEIRNKILAEEKFRREKTLQESNVLMDAVKVGGAVVGLLASVLLIAKR